MNIRKNIKTTLAMTVAAITVALVAIAAPSYLKPSGWGYFPYDCTGYNPCRAWLGYFQYRTWPPLFVGCATGIRCYTCTLYVHQCRHILLDRTYFGRTALRGVAENAICSPVLARCLVPEDPEFPVTR